MKQLALVSFLTATLAVVGFYMGTTIHGVSLRWLLPAIAGGLGGFGIGCASLDVARRWQENRAPRPFALNHRPLRFWLLTRGPLYCGDAPRPSAMAHGLTTEVWSVRKMLKGLGVNVREVF